MKSCRHRRDLLLPDERPRPRPAAALTRADLDWTRPSLPPNKGASKKSRAARRETVTRQTIGAHEDTLLDAAAAEHDHSSQAATPHPTVSPAHRSTTIRSPATTSPDLTSTASGSPVPRSRPHATVSPASTSPAVRSRATSTRVTTPDIATESQHPEIRSKAKMVMGIRRDGISKRPVGVGVRDKACSSNIHTDAEQSTEIDEGHTRKSHKRQASTKETSAEDHHTAKKQKREHRKKKMAQDPRGQHKSVQRAEPSIEQRLRSNHLSRKRRQARKEKMTAEARVMDEPGIKQEPAAGEDSGVKQERLSSEEQAIQVRQLSPLHKPNKGKSRMRDDVLIVENENGEELHLIPDNFYDFDRERQRLAGAATRELRNIWTIGEICGIVDLMDKGIEDAEELTERYNSIWADLRLGVVTADELGQAWISLPRRELPEIWAMRASLLNERDA